MNNREQFEAIIRDTLAPDQVEAALAREGDHYAEYATVLAWAVFRAVLRGDAASPSINATRAMSREDWKELYDMAYDRDSFERFMRAAEANISENHTAPDNTLNKKEMTHDIKALVNRFLAWPLPKTLASDGCATNNKYPYPRSGTNLMSGEEAEAMFRYVLAEPENSPSIAGDKLVRPRIDEIGLTPQLPKRKYRSEE